MNDKPWYEKLEVPDYRYSPTYFPTFQGQVREGDRRLVDAAVALIIHEEDPMIEHHLDVHLRSVGKAIGYMADPYENPFKYKDSLFYASPDKQLKPDLDTIFRHRTQAWRDVAHRTTEIELENAHLIHRVTGYLLDPQSLWAAINAELSKPKHSS